MSTSHVPHIATRRRCSASAGGDISDEMAARIATMSVMGEDYIYSRTMSMMDIAIRILFLGLVGFLQTSRPSFEVASIRPSTGPRQAVAAGGRVDGAQFRIAGLTIRDYISMAYAVKLNQISAPDWITTDRFDISATLPEGSQQAQVPDMIQSLLEERFQLKFHREKKDFPVYGLQVAAGGLKMREDSPDPESEQADANGPQTFTRNGS